MKIVSCPKGGRVPEGYCKESCLNYSGKPRKEKWTSPKKSSDQACDKGVKTE